MKMNQANQAEAAEAHVLDRMMHLLEEHSVAHLASQDPSFAVFVGELYESLHGRAAQIRDQP